MAHRIQPRQMNGRYERATLGNTFGLGNEVCPKCGQCHPYKVGSEPKPVKCVTCGESFVKTEAKDEQLEFPGTFTMYSYGPSRTWKPK